MSLHLTSPFLFGDLPDGIGKWATANPWPAALIVIVALIVAGIATYLIRILPSRERNSEDDFRHLVAKSVLFSAIWGTVVIASLAIFGSDRARDVLSVVLPMFGTWVGTLLAYYFGKDNYESAAKNSANLARALTGMEKLQAIPVTQPGIMIPFAKIEVPDLVKGKTIAECGSVMLKDLQAQMRQQRLPLFDPPTGAVFAVIHKSLINDFLVRQGALAPANLASATLKQLLDDADAGKIAKNSFVVVENTATLAGVKERMTQQSQRAGTTCEDAFIVAPGSTRVEGWVTNDIINANSLASAAD
jgi:hypothetical protein